MTPREVSARADSDRSADWAADRSADRLTEWGAIDPAVPSPPPYFRRNEGVGPDQFRAALAHLAAGVCVLTSRDTDGHDVGLTVTSLMSASLDPPLVVASVNANASAYPAIMRRGAWGVSLLDRSAAAVAEAFARRHAEDTVSPFETVDMRPAGRIPALLVADALATLECATEDSLLLGDHVLLVGRVVAAGAREPGSAGSDPLIRYARAYGTFAS